LACLKAFKQRLDAFAGDIEGAEHGGGYMQGVDAPCPCRIRVHGQFVVRGQTWSGLEVHYVSMPDEEVERRARLHEAEARRLQDLGFLPRYDEGVPDDDGAIDPPPRAG